MGCGYSKFNKELTENFLDKNENSDELNKFNDLLELIELLVTNNDPNSILFKDIEKYKETSIKRREYLQKYYKDSFLILEKN
jgi:hypothetical protein